MRPAAAPTMIGRFARLGREVGAVARQGRLIAAARGREAPRVAGERVVVFVHGFMAAGPVFDPMRAFVEDAAGGRVGTIDLTYSPFERFERVAGRVAEAIERVSEGRRIDLVGHSLGGIVARWYLQELGGASRVDRIVTLAAPHAGTQAARLAVGPLVRAIHPDSDVIRALREGRRRAASVAHTAIVAGADRMVTPPESAAAIDDATVHWIDGLGHNEMLFDPRVFAHVGTGLTSR
jgi:triacylglycerol lipase